MRNRPSLLTLTIIGTMATGLHTAKDKVGLGTTEQAREEPDKAKVSLYYYCLGFQQLWDANFSLP